MKTTAIVFPSLVVPRRALASIRYLDLDALRATTALRRRGENVIALDALASPGTSVSAVDAERVRVGIDDAALAARLPAGVTQVFVATPAPTAETLDALIEALSLAAPSAAIVRGLPAFDPGDAPAWDALDLDVRAAAQEVMHDGEVWRPSALPVEGLGASGWSADTLDLELANARAHGATSIVLASPTSALDAAAVDEAITRVHAHGFELASIDGLRADAVTDASLARLAERGAPLAVRVTASDDAALGRLVERASERGVPLVLTDDVGGPGQSLEEVNRRLDRVVRAVDLHGLPTRVRALPGGADVEQFLWTFDARLGAGAGPKKVIMNVTYRCNNRCTFCATGTRTQLDGNHDRQRELLAKYRALGVRLLDLDGGEPTLNARLFELVGHARRLGYEKVNVTTNARMASYREYAAKLVRCGVTSVLVSIHGPDAQTHAQNVGVAEAFEQTCEGARNLVAEAPPGVELGANITLTKSNHKKLRQVAELVVSLGLGWFNLQFLTPFGRATSSVAPDTAVAAAEAMRVIDEFRDRLKFQVINLPFCFMPGYEQYLLGDLLKLERHMLFVNNDEVNLFEYLRERRTKKPVCETCPRAVFCGGFYELDDVPEPTWLVSPEDLVRPIRREVPGAGPVT